MDEVVTSDMRRGGDTGTPMKVMKCNGEPGGDLPWGLTGKWDWPGETGMNGTGAIAHEATRVVTIQNQDLDSASN
jgi:hypothetical protein